MLVVAWKSSVIQPRSAIRPAITLCQPKFRFVNLRESRVLISAQVVSAMGRIYNPPSCGQTCSDSVRLNCKLNVLVAVEENQPIDL